MAKDSDKLSGGFGLEETGGALSGLIAEEEELDRRGLLRLGTWAALSVGAVIVALVTNQSSIGFKREQTASADLIRQAQQLQLTAREGQNETRRLANAVETLNNDRDRLYSRVSVIEQGLDSVTGAIVKQSAASSPSPQPSASVSSAPATSAAASPSVAPAASPAPLTSSAAAAAADQQPVAPQKPVPAVAPVATTAPAVTEKSAPNVAAASEPAAKVAAAAPQQTSQPAQPSSQVESAGSLVASKSIMGPPDPAAGKLIEPASPPRVASAPPKAITSAPIPEVVATISAKVNEDTERDAPSIAPEATVKRTEFGVDVGGANSIQGLRALWRGLIKSRSNVALATLHPIIVIKESTNGLGMQLRLVAGPIRDAGAAAKICASLTVSDRGCTTAVFEGQRLALNAEEQPKLSDPKASDLKASDGKAIVDAKADADPKPSPKAHRHYTTRSKPKDDAPKSEPSTLSLIFGRR